MCYPSENDLKTIEDWELSKPQDYYDLAKAICMMWKYDDCAELYGRKLQLHTMGWSGNESIMSAIDRNKMFNMACWYSSERGGHFVYELPPKK